MKYALEYSKEQDIFIIETLEASQEEVGSEERSRIHKILGVEEESDAL